MAGAPSAVFLLSLLWELAQVVCVSTALSTALLVKVIWSTLALQKPSTSEETSTLNNASYRDQQRASSTDIAPASGPTLSAGRVATSSQQSSAWIESFALYEGIVRHHRSRPVEHSFEYRVRFAVVNMDSPPRWFTLSSAKYHLSADEARQLAGTTGPVYLLTNPASVGYEQNPISVYYCYDRPSSQGDNQAGSGPLLRCISEVTNTPWGERVLFPFGPTGDAVPKPLHVSPFMDMESTWSIHAPPPGDRLSLVFTLGHPLHGRYFDASLRAQRIKRSVRVPEAFLWLMPHKIAFWIYCQALVLWWKGVPLFVHPKYEKGSEYRTDTLERDGKERKRVGVGLRATCPALIGPGFMGFTRGMGDHSTPSTITRGEPEDDAGEITEGTQCRYLWRDAASWPWNL